MPNVTKVMIHYNLLLAPKKWKAPPTGKRRTGHLQSVLLFQANGIRITRSAHLHVRELASDAGWHVCPADPDPRRQPLALIPPLAPMCLAEKTQVFPIRKNTHGDPQTLQNKHWHTSAKRPTLTVQARNASLLEPRKTRWRRNSTPFLWRNAVAPYFILRRDRETCIAAFLRSNNHAFFNDAPFGLRRRGASRTLSRGRLVARGLPGYRDIEPLGSFGTRIRRRIAGVSGIWRRQRGHTTRRYRIFNRS
jgi:hypothetical protein